MKQLFFFFLTLLIIYSCARIGNPTGGPKDITPPKVVKSVPKNNTTYFKEKKIVITFDEYIKLKDAYKEIIVSPPLKKPPIPIVRNKSLVIDIEDELKDSMTYTMNFGKSIVDNNEENPLPDYEFIFSTGKEIDSMSVMGQVMDAFTQNPPDEKVYIMLFDNVNDSAPLKEKPTYIGRSRNKGVFMINNVKTGNYKVFALNDNNSNYIFDLYDETIGFIDSTFNLHPDIIKQEEIIIQDTILVDSIIKTSQSHLIDSIMIDSIRLPGREYALFINLRLFKEENKNQYLTSYKRQQKEKLELFFSMPLMEDCLTIDPINFSPDQNWFMKEKNITNDTISLWISDTTLINKDTLLLAANYIIIDSSQTNRIYNDTIKFIYIEKDSKKSKKKKEEDVILPEEEKVLSISLNMKKGTAFDLNKKLKLITATPAIEYNTRYIELYRFDDTVQIPVKAELIKDIMKLREFNISNKWEEDTKYKLLISPGSIVDIYGKTNDTLTYNFSTKSEDFYGRIHLNISNCNTPVIIQLMDEKEKVILEQYITGNSGIDFNYLYPRIYKLKAIYDNNKNNKWDTGNYLKKIQPEKVQYYKGAINVRSNWDLEMDWELE